MNNDTVWYHGARSVNVYLFMVMRAQLLGNRKDSKGKPASTVLRKVLLFLCKVTPLFKSSSYQLLTKGLFIYLDIKFCCDAEVRL